MSYKITNYSKEQAKKLNVIIKPSKNKGKKIDVFNADGKKLASIGDLNYLDYGSYLTTKGKAYADKRRKIYRVRHANDINVINTPGYYSGKILW
jgi:hypothetical protein